MSAQIDGRRRPRVFIDTGFVESRFGSQLIERFGNEGLAIWCALLMAAKRSPLEGVFSFTSEQNAWEKLGLIEHRQMILDLGIDFDVHKHIDWTLIDYFKWTGRHHQTRTRRQGPTTYVTLTNWDEDQVRRPARDVEAAKKRRQRGDDTTTTRRRQHDLENPRSDGRNKRDVFASEPEPEPEPPPTPSKGGLEAAVEEARSDRDVTNPTGAGKYRYEQDPEKYDRIAAHADCTECRGTGEIEFHPQAGGTTYGPCPVEVRR